MKKLFLLLTALTASLVTFADGTSPKVIELTADEQQLVSNNNDFAFNLFRKARTDESIVLSPLSITYALGMLNNGARGITQQEISQVLAGGRLTDYPSVETMNAFCHKMLTESALLDEDTKVAIANNIYFNADRPELALKTPFKEAAATYYEATPSVLSFSDESTLNTINQWVADRTDGMIKDLLKPADMQTPNLVSFLLNAISFKATWANQFDEQATLKTYFDNMKRTAMMMGQVNSFEYAETSDYQSVVLPYGNGAYQMTLFLPQWGKTLDDMVAAMNGSNWNKADYKPYGVLLHMPRIETDTEQNLIDIMSSLGMPNAFDGGEGFLEFCYIGDDEANSDRCFISMMKQKAHLKLDEKGTEAAAATVIGVTDNAMPQYVEFTADRPFLYTISERSTGTIFFIGQYMGEPITNVRHDITLTDEERELVLHNNDFAFDLFRKARTNESIVLSPLSITYALGMLNNGAAGQTQQEINQVLGFSDADALNNFCRKMLDESNRLDEKTKVLIGNTVFVNEGEDISLQDGFIQKANQYYDAQPQSRDFADGLTRDVINQWASDHTNGMIKEVLSEEEFKDDMASYLLNALYFKGAWANSFDPAYTTEEAFAGGDRVDMMHQQGFEYEYTDNELYQAINMPYGNEAFRMTVFLPREGKTIGDVLAELNAQNWRFSYSYCKVDLKMPRFETSTDLGLNNIMCDLGMPTAFNAYLAEFPYFCNKPAYIDFMKQVAKIKLDEQGTEAAAVTIIGEGATSLPQLETFHATRPFLYIISEKSTGVIFFMGQFMGSTTTAISRPPSVSPKGGGPGRHVVYNLQGQRLNAVPAKGLYIQDGRLCR